ncbi:unnamed protein product, partial [Mesorhabditis spiculigera]
MLRILFLACFACLSLATGHDYLAKVEEWLKKNPELAKTTNISEAQFADFLEHTLAGWRFPWIGQNDTKSNQKYLDALDWPLIESHDPIEFERLFAGDMPKFFIPKTALTEPVLKFLKLVNGTLLPHKKSELFGISCKYHVLGFVCEIAIFPLPWPPSFLNFLGKEEL